MPRTCGRLKSKRYNINLTSPFCLFWFVFPFHMSGRTRWVIRRRVSSAAAGTELACGSPRQHGRDSFFRHIFAIGENVTEKKDNVPLCRRRKGELTRLPRTFCYLENGSQRFSSATEGACGASASHSVYCTTARFCCKSTARRPI